MESPRSPWSARQFRAGNWGLPDASAWLLGLLRPLGMVRPVPINLLVPSSFRNRSLCLSAVSVRPFVWYAPPTWANLDVVRSSRPTTAEGLWALMLNGAKARSSTNAAML